jgi:hypothetical protein
MRNLDIKFTPQGVLLSPETYSELRQFAIHHGETDLPDFPPPVVEKPKVVTKPKDE